MVLDICAGLGIEGYYPFPYSATPQNRHQGGIYGRSGPASGELVDLLGLAAT